jgi:hypothetical protein
MSRSCKPSVTPGGKWQVASIFCTKCGRSNLQVPYIVVVKGLLALCEECLGVCNQALLEAKGKPATHLSPGSHVEAPSHPS